MFKKIIITLFFAFLTVIDRITVSLPAKTAAIIQYIKPVK
jgi:hypothetical protein